jgi:hypothetical protein
MDPAFERPLPECKHRPFGLWLLHKLTDDLCEMEDGHMKKLIAGSVAALAISLIAGPVLTQPAFAEAPDSVIVGGKNVGADPDSNVRLQMRRDFGSEGF